MVDLYLLKIFLITCETFFVVCAILLIHFDIKMNKGGVI
jgi:hypothetical protein